MSQNEFVFEYDNKNSKFVNSNNFQDFELNEEEKNDFFQLINYFSEDKNYKKLSNPVLIFFFLTILIILKIIIIAMIFCTDLHIYKINNTSSTTDYKNNFNYSVIFGLSFIIYFLILIFLVTYESLKNNLFKKITNFESEAILLFSSKNQSKFIILTAHKKKPILCLKFFCVYKFKFVIKKNIGQPRRNSEKEIFLDGEKNDNNKTYTEFDQSYDTYNQTESIDFHNMSN